MQRLSYPTETVLSNKITRNRIVLSFRDSPRKPLRRRPLLFSMLFAKEHFRHLVGINADFESSTNACLILLRKLRIGIYIGINHI